MQPSDVLLVRVQEQRVLHFVLVLLFHCPVEMHDIVADGSLLEGVYHLGRLRGRIILIYDHGCNLGALARERLVCFGERMEEHVPRLGGLARPLCPHEWQATKPKLSGFFGVSWECEEQRQ